MTFVYIMFLVALVAMFLAGYFLGRDRAERDRADPNHNPVLGYAVTSDGPWPWSHPNDGQWRSETVTITTYPDEPAEVSPNEYARTDRSKLN